MGYAINADFLEDLAQHFKSELVGYGYTLSGAESVQELGIKFFNVQRRLVLPVPRTVHEADSFNCPPDLQVGLELVRDKITRGLDLRPHLSTRILDSDYNDPLLNDWGIHHLHLGTVIDGRGFVDRTGPVLFAHFTDTEAYLVNVIEHGAWSQQDMVRALHRSWPEAFARYRLNVLGLAVELSDNDVRRLRAGHVQTFVEVEPGVVYAPIGGGYMTNGVSFEVLRTADNYIARARACELALRKNIENVISKLLEAGVTVGPQLAFELRYDSASGTLFAYEPILRVSVLLEDKGTA